MAHRGAIGGFVIGVMLAGAAALAGTPQPVDNPYQGEFPFAVGEPVTVGVTIGGVVWEMFSATPQGKIRSGRPVKTVLEMAFDNGTANTVDLIVVVLFEDERGESLDRIELDPVTLSAGRARRFRKKVKIQADVLSAAAKVYLFCEVRPH